MNLPIQLLSIITLSIISNFSFGQTKNYYRNKLGITIDQPAYDEQKIKSLENVRIKMKSMQIFEELNELYSRNDSTVYSYIWHFTDRPKKKKKEIAKKKEMIGKEYPIKNEKTLSGRFISIDDLKGKPTLINLWFTACAPCIKEIPVLNQLKSIYNDRFNFLSITFDSEDKVNQLLAKHNFDFEHIVGSKELTTKLGFNGYPVNLFLDKNGIVRIIEGNVPYTYIDGKLEMGDGIEFIQLLENLR